MSKYGRIIIGLLVAITSLAVLFSSGFTQEVGYVNPGDYGSIILPARNNAASAGPMEGVKVDVTAPSYFIVKGASLLGPVSISAGIVYEFKIDYEIDSNAPEGSFDVQFHLSMTTVKCIPRTSDTLHRFTIKPDTTPPVLSNLTTSQDPQAAALTVTATASDEASFIQAAECYISGGSKVDMLPQDGAFDELTEDIAATIPISHLIDGQLSSVFVRAKDISSNWSGYTRRQFEVIRDTDSDGIRDQDDPDITDTDNDGIPNTQDPDDDNDGLPDEIDNSPRVPNPDQTDTDSDGIGDVSDPDDDNDTIPDKQDNAPKHFNPDQLDTNNNGIGDVAELDTRLNDITDITDKIDNEWTTMILTARDPNELLVSPEGDIKPGELLNYTINYENEGEGIAYGVYITDILEEDLDDTTLAINNNGSYNPNTRTLTWLIGELGSKQKGSVSFSVNAKPDLADGTEIINFATVYFPSVPEATRTNGTVNRITTYIDNTPPTTTAQPYPQPNPSGWNNTDITITLTSQDNQGGSRISKTEYSLDNTTWTDYTTPFTITNEGTTTLYYKSTDNAGNTEPANSLTVKLDKTPPVITLSLNPIKLSEEEEEDDDEGNWYKLLYSAQDPISGLNTLTAGILIPFQSGLLTLNNGQILQLKLKQGEPKWKIKEKDNKGIEIQSPSIIFKATASDYADNTVTKELEFSKEKNDETI